VCEVRPHTLSEHGKVAGKGNALGNENKRSGQKTGQDGIAMRFIYEHRATWLQFCEVLFVYAERVFESGYKTNLTFRRVRGEGERAMLFAAWVFDVKREGKARVLSWDVFYRCVGCKHIFPYIIRELDSALKRYNHGGYCTRTSSFK